MGEMYDVMMKCIRKTLKQMKKSKQVSDEVVEAVERLREPICDPSGKLTADYKKMLADMEAGRDDLVKTPMGFSISRAKVEESERRKARQAELKEKLRSARKAREANAPEAPQELNRLEEMEESRESTTLEARRQANKQEPPSADPLSKALQDFSTRTKEEAPKQPPKKALNEAPKAKPLTSTARERAQALAASKAVRPPVDQPEEKLSECSVGDRAPTHQVSVQDS